MCQPYIVSATTLSDDIDDEEIARIFGLCWAGRAAKIDFQRLS